MARIKISDLPHNRKISEEELREIVGGSGVLRITAPFGGSSGGSYIHEEMSEEAIRAANTAKDLWEDALRLLRDNAQRELQEEQDVFRI